MTSANNPVTHVEIRGVTKKFGDFTAISNLDLKIEMGKFYALLGPSGCGKSTLLRMIAGLERASSGSIHINAADVTDVPPAKRRIAMVFQSYALYPHMTVRQNIAFSLAIAGESKAVQRQRADEVAQTLQLSELMDRKPAQLSGGQRQRVAIGRSLVRNPEVFLFDEPLSNLDAALRAQMRIELSDLHRKLGTTMIYVTHDQVEAMTMADKIVVLNAGRIEQVGSPMELYDYPVSPFVAGFIGSPKMNLYEGQAATALGCKTYGIRPEHLLLAADNPRWTGTVRHVERLGADSLIHLDVPILGQMVVRADGNASPVVGARQGLSPVSGREFRFN